VEEGLARDTTRSSRACCRHTYHCGILSLHSALCHLVRVSTEMCTVAGRWCHAVSAEEQAELHGDYAALPVLAGDLMASSPLLSSSSSLSLTDMPVPRFMQSRCAVWPVGTFHCLHALHCMCVRAEMDKNEWIAASCVDDFGILDWKEGGEEEKVGLRIKCRFQGIIVRK
jgi:hypothetical protein